MTTLIVEQPLKCAPFLGCQRCQKCANNCARNIGVSRLLCRCGFRSLRVRVRRFQKSICPVVHIRPTHIVLVAHRIAGFRSIQTRLAHSRVRHPEIASFHVQIGYLQAQLQTSECVSRSSHSAVDVNTRKSLCCLSPLTFFRVTNRQLLSQCTALFLERQHSRVHLD